MNDLHRAEPFFRIVLSESPVLPKTLFESPPVTSRPNEVEMRPSEHVVDGEPSSRKIVLLSVSSILCLSVPFLAQDAPVGDFGAAYSSLRPEQKQLVDDWFARFSAVVKKPVNAAEGYSKLPLSGKTTFNAV